MPWKEAEMSKLGEEFILRALVYRPSRGVPLCAGAIGAAPGEAHAPRAPLNIHPQAEGRPARPSLYREGPSASALRRQRPAAERVLLLAEGSSDR